jgi:hypothetical protein
VSAARKITIGFQGGQVLAVRVEEKALRGLYDALEKGGWHELESEDGMVRLYVPQVVYVSAEGDEPRVGFG